MLRRREIKSPYENVVESIRQYNPKHSFVEFRKYLENNSYLMVVLNNKHVKADVINELIEAARKRISFLIEDDDKILELYKENKELLDNQMSSKMCKLILQMHYLVSNAKSESTSVETICKNFADRGSSVFASQKVLKYLQRDENLVSWLYAEREKDISIKYINKLCALMIAEHIHGDMDELNEIAMRFPKSIDLALFDKLRNTEKARNQNPESAR